MPSEPTQRQIDALLDQAEEAAGANHRKLVADKATDRDFASSLVNTERLGDVGRERIMREAHAMGRLPTQTSSATEFGRGDRIWH